MAETNVDEGKPDVDELQDKDGKHPETVTWTQYVGIKEKLGKIETGLKEKVVNLEEQLKATVSTEELNKAKADLTKATADHQLALDELKTIKDKSSLEKREYLKGKGIPEDKISVMSEEALAVAVGVLEQFKPKPDLGGGGGGTSLKGSPMELARQAYESKK